jgi:hypothetical protein
VAYITSAVERYGSVVTVWQVENEPFFAFGDCPAPDVAFFEKEIALVRHLDPSAQIQVTTSGEQEVWSSVAPVADRIGVSLYRTVRIPQWGLFSFPLSPLWYTVMRIPVSFTRDVVISELQMEPWFVDHPLSVPRHSAAGYFTAQDARDHVAYARATGFSEVSFWGVEWWYYLRIQGYPELWDTMRNLLKTL